MSGQIGTRERNPASCLKWETEKDKIKEQLRLILVAG